LTVPNTTTEHADLPYVLTTTRHYSREEAPPRDELYYAIPTPVAKNARGRRSPRAEILLVNSSRLPSAPADADQRAN
jgi:hypothetical protein